MAEILEGTRFSGFALEKSKRKMILDNVITCSYKNMRGISLRHPDDTFREYYGSDLAYLRLKLAIYKDARDEVDIKLKAAKSVATALSREEGHAARLVKDEAARLEEQLMLLREKVDETRESIHALMEYNNDYDRLKKKFDNLTKNT